MHNSETLQKIYQIATSSSTEAQKIRDISHILTGIPSSQLNDLQNYAGSFNSEEGLCNAIKSHSKCPKVVEFLRNHKLCSGEILTPEEAGDILMDVIEEAFRPPIDLSKEYNPQPKRVISKEIISRAHSIFSDVMQFSDDNPARIKDHFCGLDSASLAELKVAFVPYQKWVCTEANKESKPNTTHLLAEHGLCPGTYVAGKLLDATAIDENATAY